MDLWPPSEGPRPLRNEPGEQHQEPTSASAFIGPVSGRKYAPCTCLPSNPPPPRFRPLDFVAGVSGTAHGELNISTSGFVFRIRLLVHWLIVGHKRVDQW